MSGQGSVQVLVGMPVLCHAPAQSTLMVMMLMRSCLRHSILMTLQAGLEYAWGDPGMPTMYVGPCSVYHASVYDFQTCEGRITIATHASHDSVE